MIDTQKIIESAKMKLGAPIRSVELNDEQMACLLDDAYEAFILYSEIADLEEKKFFRIQDNWIKKYFFALCKESLARVRGKFSGKMQVPGADIELDYKSLLIESDREKRFLRYLILKDENVLNNNSDEVILVFYVNTGGLDNNDVSEFMESVKKSLDKNDGFTKYFIPVRDIETKIECIYPVGLNITQTEEGKKLIDKLNNHLLDNSKKEDDEQ